MAVLGPRVYVADTYNHAVKIFTHADGVLRDIFGGQRSARLGEFNEPYGIAVGDGQMIISEGAGRRIQVLSLEGEPLQMIRFSIERWRTWSNPDVHDEYDRVEDYQLGLGLCLDESRLWCVGPNTSLNHADIFVRI